MLVSQTQTYRCTCIRADLYIGMPAPIIVCDLMSGRTGGDLGLKDRFGSLWGVFWGVSFYQPWGPFIRDVARLDMAVCDRGLNGLDHGHGNGLAKHMATVNGIT
jgi:hypothetical protein